MKRSFGAKKADKNGCMRDINTKLFQATVKSARTKDAMQFLIDDSGIEQFSDREKRRCDG